MDYQPIYDGVRSRITNGDIGEAVSTVFRELNLSHYAHHATETVREVAYEYSRPSAVWRPKLSIDGNKWCALYGDNLHEGVAGFGDSPAEAMRDFDLAWGAKLITKTTR